MPRRPDPVRSRQALAERLRERRAEIEEALLTRVHAIADPPVADPAYAIGLREAVAAAVEYGITALGSPGTSPTPIPVSLLGQARLAARNGVGLDVVLRRYSAGYSIFGELLAEEAEAMDLSVGELNDVLRAQAAALDRLLAAIGEEHERESRRRPAGAEERRVEQVKRLLDGEPLDVSELGYDFDAHHLGLLVVGGGVKEALRAFAASRDRRVLLVHPDESTCWAWFGSRRPISSDLLEELRGLSFASGVRVALGEPGEELAGWRLTHRQAAAALTVAQHGPEHFVRYSEVALLASIIQDDLLTKSLRQIYLAPLRIGNDGGSSLRETLRAYFAANRNVSSTAAALGAGRNTVTRRLALVERQLGQPLTACASTLEVALDIEALDEPGTPPAR